VKWHLHQSPINELCYCQICTVPVRVWVLVHYSSNRCLYHHCNVLNALEAKAIILTGVLDTGQCGGVSRDIIILTGVLDTGQCGGVSRDIIILTGVLDTGQCGGVSRDIFWGENVVNLGKCNFSMISFKSSTVSLI
jgi:uncharacterized membrane protein YeiH